MAEQQFGPEHLDTLILVNNLALLYQKQGRYGEAEPLFLRALEARERILGPEHPNTLALVTDLASLYQDQGRYAEAERLYLRALEASERILGPEHPDTLILVNNLASLYQDQGRYGESGPLYLRALEASGRVLGSEHPNTLYSVNNLALFYRSQGRHSEAGPLLRKTLKNSERILGPEHPVTLSLINNLATIYEDQGRYGEAESLYVRALEANEHVLGAEHPNTLTSVNNLAVLFESQGRYAESEPLYLRALTTTERLLGPEHPDTLISVNNLAVLYMKQGRYDKAEPLFLETLAHSEGVLGPAHVDTVILINNLASLYQNQGRYGEAEQLFLRALEADEGVLGPEHTKTLTSVNNLALLYIDQGRYGEAEPLVLRVLEATERLLGMEHPYTLSTLNNLALLYDRQRRYAESEPLYLRGLTTTERLLGPEHPSTLTSMNNLALLYRDQGRYQEAEPLLRRVLEASERVLGPEHPKTLSSVNNLALLFDDQGEYGEAEPLYLRALASFQRRATSTTRGMGISSGNYAMLLFNQLSSLAPATFYQKRAVDVLQAIRTNMSDLEVSTQRAFLADNVTKYSTLQSLLVSSGRFAEAAQVGGMIKELEAYEYGRRSSGGEDPRLSRIGYTPREQGWADKIDAWAAESTPIVDAIDVLRGRERQGETLSEANEAKLEALGADYDAAMAVFVERMQGWAETAGQRDAQSDAELLAYQAEIAAAQQAEVATMGAGVAVVQVTSLDDRTYAFLTTADTFETFSTEAGSGDVYAAIFKAREALETAGRQRGSGFASDVAEASDTGVEAALQELDRLLLPADLKAALKASGTQTLLFNLQGAIRYAPMAALYDGERYLVETYDLALYTPAAQTDFTAPEAITRAAGFGVTRGFDNFAALPGVAQELEDLLPGSDGKGILDGVYYLDADFTREVLERELAGAPPVAHIASHFEMRPGDDTRSFLLLGDGSELPLSYITSSDAMSFEGVELVTLSACSTAMSSSEGTGAEIEGFGVLAQQKGARSVVATLWNVADEGTAEFMEGFYTRLADGESKAEAMRAAQREMIASDAYSAPYYWAPYILMGNWK
jgi:CHAT domain-containing protein/tetratricopeptide (TPR) repeat protein